MKKVIGIILGIVLVVAVLGLSFYAGTKYANRNDKKVEPTKGTDVIEEPVLLTPDNKLVSDAMSTIPNYMCHGYALSFPKKDRTVNDLTDDEKLGMVTAYFGSDLNFDDIDDSEEYTGEMHVEVKESDVESLFEDTSFLKKLTKNKDDNLYGLGYKGFYYNFDDHKYYANIIATGCTDGDYKDHYLQFFKAEKTGNELAVDYAYAYVSVQYNEKTDKYTNSLYKNKGDKTPVVANAEMDDEGEFNTDWAQFHHYEFIYDVSNNNLRLQKIKFIEAK